MNIAGLIVGYLKDNKDEIVDGVNILIKGNIKNLLYVYFS